MIIEFFDPSSRSGDERRKIVEEHDLSARMSQDYHRYGRDYFDDPDSGVGYGRYRYDGRFAEAAKRMCDHYGLSRGDRVLEFGCAKGFLLVEYQKLGMNVSGLDMSEYAVSNSHPDVRDAIQLGDASEMPFEDDEFQLIVGKEVLPHLPKDRIVAAITECMRVSSGGIFFEIQTGDTAKELDYLQRWDGTHRTMRSPAWWDDLFKRLEYPGDVHYKILIPEQAPGQEK